MMVFFVRVHFVALVRRHAAEDFGPVWGLCVEHESGSYDQGSETIRFNSPANKVRESQKS